MTIAIIICAIVITASLVAVVLYFLLSFMPRMQRTINFAENEAKDAMDNLAKTAVEINAELRKVGEAMDNLNDLVKSLKELNGDHIKPLLDSVNQIATSVNRSVSKVEDVVDETNRFAKKSLHLAAFYRDKLFVPVIEVVSLWSGIKAAVSSLLKKGG